MRRVVKCICFLRGVERIPNLAAGTMQSWGSQLQNCHTANCHTAAPCHTHARIVSHPGTSYALTVADKARGMPAHLGRHNVWQASSSSHYWNCTITETIERHQSTRLRPGGHNQVVSCCQQQMGSFLTEPWQANSFPRENTGYVPQSSLHP